MNTDTLPNVSHNTDIGRGTLTPMLRVASTLVALHTALAAEWPITPDFFRNTLTECRGHLEIMFIPLWMTGSTVAAVRQWRDQVTDMVRSMGTGTPNDYRPGLQTLITDSWNLTQLLDQELVGLPENMTDAGQVI